MLLLKTGRTDWANFRPTGDCLLWAVILKITEIVHSFGMLFHG
jgi:hypothetical protein